MKPGSDQNSPNTQGLTIDALIQEAVERVVRERLSSLALLAPTSPPRLLVLFKEACALVGVSRNQGYEMCRCGEWASSKIGRRLLVNLKSLEQWANRVTSGKET
jgi:excisionase family DNA binding protein